MGLTWAGTQPPLCCRSAGPGEEQSEIIPFVTVCKVGSHYWMHMGQIQNQFSAVGIFALAVMGFTAAHGLWLWHPVQLSSHYYFFFLVNSLSYNCEITSRTSLCRWHELKVVQANKAELRAPTRKVRGQNRKSKSEGLNIARCRSCRNEAKLRLCSSVFLVLLRTSHTLTEQLSSWYLPFCYLNF